MNKQSFRIAAANARVSLPRGKAQPMGTFYFYNCARRGIIIGRNDGTDLSHTSKDLLGATKMPACYRRTVLKYARSSGPLPLPR